MSDLIAARVLVDCTITDIKCVCNTLIEHIPAVIAQHKEAGHLDDSETAVEHLLNQGVTPVVIYDESKVVNRTSVANYIHLMQPATKSVIHNVIKAIESLDKDKQSLWTSKGVPKTDSIESVMGVSVSAAERDAAWQAIKESETN